VSTLERCPKEVLLLGDEFDDAFGLCDGLCGAKFAFANMCNTGTSQA